ncbi:unnamed protein product [Rotaria sp. Silwood1]|nr:unnamed protein product [Rotaria sp. Silwood1]
MTCDNHLLDNFELSVIPPAPRGLLLSQLVVKIKIALTSDEAHLLKREIERMIANVEKYKKEDEIQRERISIKNSLESYCFNMKTSINYDKISSDD